MDRKIIVISGPSGVGKTTLYKKLLEKYKNKLGFSISATTRPKRETEIDGQDYYFISEEKFNDLINKDEFIEWEQVFSYYYGTLKSEIYRVWNDNKDCLLDIDVKGGVNIQKMFEQKAFLIFIAPPCMQELESRLRSRGQNDERSLNKRLEGATLEMESHSYYDLVLVNQDFDKTLDELYKVIDSLLQ